MRLVGDGVDGVKRGAQVHSLVPAGWQPSSGAVTEFQQNLPDIRNIVQACAATIPAASYFDRQDMESEGTCVALYAIDRHRRRYSKQPLLPFIHCVVSRSLISRMRGLQREQRRCVPMDASDTIRELRQRAVNPIASLDWFSHLEYKESFDTFLHKLRVKDRATVLLALSPPPELLVLNRNMKRGRAMNSVSRRAIARYMGRSLYQVHRSFIRCQRAARSVGLGEGGQ